MTDETAAGNAARATERTIPDGGLDLGPGEPPQDAAGWEQRLRAAGNGLLAGEAADLRALWAQTALSVTVEHAPDPVTEAPAAIDEVTLDATGVRATQESLEAIGRITPPMPPERTDGVPVRIHRATVRAHPAYLDGTPVRLDCEVADLGVLLTRDRQGHLWMQTDPDRVLHDLRARARVSIAEADLTHMVRDLVSAQIAAMGATLTDLQVQITTRDERTAVVEVAAKVKKGLLSASAQFRVGARVDDQMVARLGQIQARSGNPLVGMILAAVRGRLDRYADREYDLNAYLPAGLRLVDLRLRADTDLVAEVVLG